MYQAASLPSSREVRHTWKLLPANGELRSPKALAGALQTHKVRGLLLPDIGKNAGGTT